MFIVVIVGVVTNKLALVFILGIRNLESGDTLYKVNDTIITDVKPPNL